MLHYKVFEQKKIRIRKKPTNFQTFEQLLSNARKETKDQAREVKEKGTYIPADGSYAISYTDRGKVCSGFAFLTFIDQGNGYDIHGSIKDDDGSSSIMEGFAAYDGTAYWKDRCSEGDVGLTVLSRGQFDYQTGIFTGTWESSAGMFGVYNIFYPVVQNAPQPVEQYPPETSGQKVCPEAEIIVEASMVYPNATSDNTKEVPPVVPSAFESGTNAVTTSLDKMESGLKK